MSLVDGFSEVLYPYSYFVSQYVPKKTQIYFIYDSGDISILIFSNTGPGSIFWEKLPTWQEQIPYMLKIFPLALDYLMDFCFNPVPEAILCF